MLALREELKERNCEICWFKLCSSKFTITSLTRSDLSAISKGALSCSSTRTFSLQNGAVGDWADALQHARKPKSSSDRELRFGNVHRLCELFQQLSLMLKTKNYCEAINIAIVCTTRVLQQKKLLVFGKVALFNFCWRAERWMSSRLQK